MMFAQQEENLLSFDELNDNIDDDKSFDVEMVERREDDKDLFQRDKVENATVEYSKQAARNTEPTDNKLSSEDDELPHRPPPSVTSNRTSTLGYAMTNPINHDFLLRSVGKIAKYAYGVASVEVWFCLPDQGDVLVQPPGGYWRKQSSHPHWNLSYGSTTGDATVEDQIHEQQRDALRRLEHLEDPDYVGPARLGPGEGIPGALWWMSSAGARDENLLRTLVKYKGRNYMSNSVRSSFFTAGSKRSLRELNKKTSTKFDHSPYSRHDVQNNDTKRDLADHETLTQGGKIDNKVPPLITSKPFNRHRRVRTTGTVTFSGSTAPVSTSHKDKRNRSYQMKGERLPTTINSTESDEGFLESPLELKDVNISEQRCSDNDQPIPDSKCSCREYEEGGGDLNDYDDGEKNIDNTASTRWMGASPSELNVRDLRKVVWHDIREFVLDPLQPPNPRMVLLYKAGYTHVTGVTFNIRGQRGIVVYYAINPNLEELRRPVHHAYLLCAADLMGAEASLMVARTTVAEYQVAQREEGRHREGRGSINDEQVIVEAGIKKCGKDIPQTSEDMKKGRLQDHNDETEKFDKSTQQSSFHYMKASFTDRLGTPSCCEHQRKTFINWKRKWKGMGLTPPPPMPNHQVVITFLSIFVTMFIVGLFGHAGNYFTSAADNHGFFLPLGPMGAMLSLTFGLPAAPLGQPRNILLGQILSISIGIAFNYMLPASTVGYGLAALRTALVASTCAASMVKCGVLHPPATALAFIFADKQVLDLSLLFSFGAVIIADIFIIGCLVAINNVSSKRQYPLYWCFFPSLKSCTKTKPKNEVV